MNFKKRLTGLFLLTGLCATQTHAIPYPEKSHYIEVEAKDKVTRSLVTRLGYSIDEVLSDKIFFIGHPSDVEKLAKLNLKAKAHPLQERWFDFETQTLNSRYTTYEEVVQQLQDLEKNYSGLATLLSLGKSLENRDVPLLRISSRSLGQAANEELPVVFYTGCHHAREHLSVEVPLMFARHLLEQYGRNPEITRLLDTRELYISPIVNPDGHVYDYRNGLRGNMWRKNRRRNNDGSFGVDLNRNYGFQWGTGGSSNSPRSDVYMGTAPFSEPESQNVKHFIERQPRMTTLISFHTFSELILYPWGHTFDKIGQKEGLAEDLPIFEKMARDMSRWNGYTPQQSSDLYIASGDTTDWAYGVHGIYAFTFELSPKSMWQGGFYPSPSVIQPTFEANIKPMLYMMEFADNPKRVLTERMPNFLETPVRVGVGIASSKDLSL
jgi:carboxypeptidase T